ncbi:uncharacterized protein MELLADRAFT_103697 [Melampsora larici-populina 98AG31]|uniref:Uncharacterized protein n=1 Tax=Melampsora larici-populina (strain 98AG31 / pathotype 3-4-7) TaxID=747676 RepID=F4RCN5_MELLP|nr:uncharacterized protein MELLADRAFT_103697 [Melampsora larici-populina 98AG31]EGG09662.1 hypothetical protein MELLADRAFT_103697 [Melampsora larici-populina 98AG31]
MLNFLTSYKGLSSLIRGRTKRKEKSSCVISSDGNGDSDLFEVSPEFLVSSSHPIISNMTCQPISPPNQSNSIGSKPLTKADSLRSNTSVLSKDTRSTLRHIYQQWDHEKEFEKLIDDDADDDENEELASVDARLETDSEFDFDSHYKSIYIKKIKPQETLSDSTLCTVDSSLLNYPEKFQSDNLRKSSIESLEDQSLSTLADDELPIQKAVKIENFYQNQNLLFYDHDDDQSTNLQPFPFTFPKTVSKTNSTNSFRQSNNKRQIKRVKSRLDLKTIEVMDTNRSKPMTTTTKEKASYYRKRRSGMIGGYHHLTEFNQKLNVISIIKKTSQPILKLKLSISSLNGTLPTSIASECGMYASNFIEVLEYDKKRVHEIQFNQQEESNQINRLETLDCRTDSYNLTLSPGTSITSATPIYKQPKRVHFLEPIATFDHQEPVPCSPPTPKNRFLSLPLVPSLTSYCQRKKEDWSSKRKSQYLNISTP